MEGVINNAVNFVKKCKAEKVRITIQRTEELAIEILKLKR